MKWSLLVLCFVACKEAPATPPDAPKPEVKSEVKSNSNASGEAELTRIRAERAQAGETGTQAGTLWEQEGDVLAKLGQWQEAAAAYDHARMAYGQSPEATPLPVVRAEAAKKKAEAARAH